MAATSLCACSIDVPRFSTAMTLTLRAARGGSSSRSGIYNSERSGNLNPGGMTPTTVRARSLMTTPRPMIPGSPPKRRCQRPCVRMTTDSSPGGAASSAVKERPRMGSTPSIENISVVTDTPTSRSASDSLVTVKLRPRNPATSSNDCDCRRTSTKSQYDRLESPQSSGCSRCVECNVTTRSLRSPNGSGRRSNALTRLNTVTLAPIPNASVTSAAARNPGRRRRPRIACDRSWKYVGMVGLSRTTTCQRTVLLLGDLVSLRLEERDEAVPPNQMGGTNDDKTRLLLGDARLNRRNPVSVSLRQQPVV